MFISLLGYRTFASNANGYSIGISLVSISISLHKIYIYTLVLRNTASLGRFNAFRVRRQVKRGLIFLEDGNLELESWIFVFFFTRWSGNILFELEKCINVYDEPTLIVRLTASLIRTNHIFNRKVKHESVRREKGGTNENKWNWHSPNSGVIFHCYTRLSRRVLASDTQQPISSRDRTYWFPATLNRRGEP